MEKLSEQTTEMLFCIPSTEPATVWIAGSCHKSKELTVWRRSSYFFSIVASQRLSTTGWVILLGVLAVIVLIVILPQVDLLDTAFHRNTSPLGIRAACTSAPSTTLSAGFFGAQIVPARTGQPHSVGDRATDPASTFIATFDMSLRV